MTPAEIKISNDFKRFQRNQSFAPGVLFTGADWAAGLVTRPAASFLQSRTRKKSAMAYRTEAEIERENEQIRRRIVALESHLAAVRKGSEAAERDALAEAQRKADEVFALLGSRAPSPGVGQTAIQYRRAILRRLQKYSPAFANSDVSGLDAPSLELVERQVFADVQAAAGAAHRPGVLVAQQSRDAAGRLVTRFAGDPMAWMQHFMRGGARGRIVRPPMQGGHQ